MSSVIGGLLQCSYTAQATKEINSDSLVFGDPIYQRLYYDRTKSSMISFKSDLL